MRSTVAIMQTFRGDDHGVTVRCYEVHAPAAPKRGGDECVSLADLARAERCLALAAMQDGFSPSSVLRFARTALDLTVEMMAKECMTLPSSVRLWEKMGDAPVDILDDIAALLDQSDRGAMEARRL
jgi:hypothetical protein